MAKEKLYYRLCVMGKPPRIIEVDEERDAKYQCVSASQGSDLPCDLTDTNGKYIGGTVRDDYGPGWMFRARPNHPYNYVPSHNG